MTAPSDCRPESRPTQSTSSVGPPVAPHEGSCLPLQPLRQPPQGPLTAVVPHGSFYYKIEQVPNCSRVLIYQTVGVCRLVLSILSYLMVPVDFLVIPPRPSRRCSLVVHPSVCNVYSSIHPDILSVKTRSRILSSSVEAEGNQTGEKGVSVDGIMVPELLSRSKHGDQ